MDELFCDLDAMLQHLQPRADHDPVAHEMLYRYVLPLMQEVRAWRLLHLQRGSGYSEGQVTAVLGHDRLWWRTAANTLQQYTAMWGEDQWRRYRDQHPPRPAAPPFLDAGQTPELAKRAYEAWRRSADRETQAKRAPWEQLSTYEQSHWNRTIEAVAQTLSEAMGTR